MGDVLVVPGGGGGDLDAITAGAGDVLTGKTILNREGEPVAGTLSLSGNADASKVLNGYTFYNTNAKSKLTGTLQVTSVVSFNVAQYSNLTLIASWARPSRGPWSGLRVICKQGGYPSNASDGTLFYEGSGTSATKSLAAGTWYFRAWNYITTNNGRIYGGYENSSSNNIAIRGQQVFTSSGTFTVPAMVRLVNIFCVGAGGAGGHGSSGKTGGGGGAGYTNTVSVNIAPGEALSVVIGGIAGNQGNGGSTYVSHSGTNLIYSSGGNGGNYSAAGNGGSGGGSPRANGGSNGSNGNLYSGTAGKGQGSTTRAFGESSGTLYAGGGGGGDGGSGGAGGGGNGSPGYSDPDYGSDGTGGGGGGGSNNWYSGAPGGSGICIIRWGY